MARALALLALAGAAVAANSTTSVNVLFIAAGVRDPSQLAGSVAGASPNATTLVVGCAAGADCGLAAPVTIVDGPLTYSADIAALAPTAIPVSGEELPFSIAENKGCKRERPDGALSCDVVAAVQISGMEVRTAVSVPLPTDLAEGIVPVAITAGAENLAAAAPGATPTGSGSTMTTVAPAAAGNRSESSSPGSASPTASSSGSSSRASSAVGSGNAVGAAATHNAVLAGVAAFVGVMVL